MFNLFVLKCKITKINRHNKEIQYFFISLHKEIQTPIMKKALKITSIVIGSIIAFILLIFVFASLFGGSIAKNYVNNHAEDLIGRHANIDHVGLNLFTGHVAIEGLTIYEDDAKEKFAGFDTLNLGVSLLRLVGQTVYVRHITLAGLDVNVLQNGSRFNFSSILDHFAKDSTEVEEVEDTTPSSWVISVHNIRLANGSAKYTDVQKNSRWGFKDLNLIVPDFSLGGKDNTDAGLSLALADGGALNVDATYNAESNDFSANLQLSNFALNQAKAYVVDMANVEEIHGRLDLNAEAKGNLSQIMDMEITAKASIDDVNIIDNQHASVASLNHLGVDVNKVVLSQNLFDISSVELNGLQAKYEMFADSTFVDVIGTSKGKGFQGVVKRHGFGGVGQATHGQDDRLRKPGSIGACSYPAKVFKGMRMGGQMGNERVTTHNLQVLKVIPEHNLLLIKGSVPGFKGSIVVIEK